MYNHEMYVRSSDPNSNEPKDAEMFGEIVLKNGLNGNEYVFAIWNDEDEVCFQSEDLEEGFYNTVWMTGIPKKMDLTNKELCREILGDELIQMSLADFVNNDKYLELLTKIEAYYKEGVEFNEKIQQSEQFIDLHGYIIEEEVCRIINLAIEGGLTSKDVINFGELSKDSDSIYGEVEYLKPYLDKAVNDELSISNKEKVINAYNVLKLEVPENLKDKEIELIQER